MTAKNYIELNRDSWNKRTEHHVTSEFYDLQGFLNGKNSLNKIELDLLGDIKGKSILHLQCHFGQDSLSLARMGATVTGVDLSDKAIEKAIQLNDQLELDAEFICCDIYDLKKHLDKKFDVVFSSYGTIGWLPDLDKWAEIVDHFMKPGGQFIFAEFHPVVWMFDDDFSFIQYNYFKEDPIIESNTGTYTDHEAQIEHTSVGWNHSLSEVVQALFRQSLKITNFKEYNYSPYNCLKGMEQVAEGKFQIKKFGNKLPLVYSLVITK
jgi:2-polyprenyl-3-methyl-5-hydroxy-6-metoxy-1,4-benzoquinol methylase